MSASAWQGWLSSVSAFMTGTDDAAASDSSRSWPKVRTTSPSRYLASTLPVSSMVSPRPSCRSRSESARALPASLSTATSKETLVRVEGFSKMSPTTLPASGLYPLVPSDFRRTASSSSDSMSSPESGASVRKSAPPSLFLSTSFLSLQVSPAEHFLEHVRGLHRVFLGQRQRGKHPHRAGRDVVEDDALLQAQLDDPPRNVALELDGEHQAAPAHLAHPRDRADHRLQP